MGHMIEERLEDLATREEAQGRQDQEGTATAPTTDHLRPTVGRGRITHSGKESHPYL